MVSTGRISQVRRALLCLIPAAAVLATVPAAVADDAPNLDRMEERLQHLENELQATRDELRASKTRADTQQDILERAGLAEDGEPTALSSLSRFLEETDFEGWVTASYVWNFNRPRDESGWGANTGNPVLGVTGEGLGFRQHPDHNSFQFDQAWFSMSRDASEESRGGFAVDLVFGQTADVLGGSDVAVYQAYAEYLAPLGPGFLVRVGRFASPLRAEPIQALHRFNITEGLLAGQFHPDSHTGGTISTQIGPVRLMVGGANDTLLDPEGDLGDGKAVLFGAGVDVSDTITFDVNGVWGESGQLPGNMAPGVMAPSHVTGTDMGIVSAIVRWTPSDLLTTYADFTYLWTHDPVSVQGGGAGTVLPIDGSPHGFGFVVGSHYMVTERTSFGFRGEAIWGKDNLLDPTLSGISGTSPKRNVALMALTGTLEHALTESMGFRVEGRFDAGSRAGSRSDHVFYRDYRKDGTGAPNLRAKQWIAAVEAYYRF